MAAVTANIGPESGLLVSCCRSLNGHVEDDVLGALSAELDWNRIIRLADWHRVSPLLHRRLGREDLSGRVPDHAIRHFEAAYYTTAARAALYEQELESVLQLLEDSEIPVLLLKGSALLDTIYSDPGLRSMNDLDLLVPADRIEEAESSLTRHGWAATEHRGSERMRESFRHVPGLINPEGTATVELHRALVSPPLAWNIQGVWERATSRLPAAEDLLAHVALHFFMDRHEHLPGALRQLVDLAEIATSHPSLDWDLVAGQAEESRMVGPLSCGLWAAHYLLSMEVPDWASDVPASDPRGAAAFIEQRVLGSAAWPLHGLVEPKEEYSPLRVLRNLSTRVFPSRRFLESRYGASSKIPLVWWFSHLRDLARRWGKSASMPGMVRRGLLADRWLHSMIDRESPQPSER